MNTVTVSAPTSPASASAPLASASVVYIATTTTFALSAGILYYLTPKMTSLLRSLVAGPRLQHAGSNLDLCYVSSSAPIIIAMSMPATSYPKRAYRNPHDQVLSFLTRAHGENWAIWEFRAEGTGYGDDEFRGRVFHAPFPDHHPPPFGLVPGVVASMRNHLRAGADKVVVVHCKAGKGRSGTMSCAYLIAEEGFSADDAMAAFTRARMRPGWGEGVSIPSQCRWLRYVEAWTRDHAKRYVERKVRVHAVHVWGLRAGVRVTVRGFVNEGKEIQNFHIFTHAEKRDMTAGEREKSGAADVILEPATPLFLPSSDINIDFERRTHAKYGLAMVTSVAHVWFNAFFEGNGGEESGVFEIAWKEMDGIKGTSRKGVQALEKLQVVWSVEREGERIIEEPKEGEPVSMVKKAPTEERESDTRDLGLRMIDTTPTGSDILGDSSSPESSPSRTPDLASRDDASCMHPGKRVNMGATSQEVDNVEEEPFERKGSRSEGFRRHGGAATR
jgi:protein-tyrosine phosphatase